MPLRLEIKKKLSARSDRVKCVDLHPQESWVLSALYSGNVYLWDIETASLLKSWEVCDLPVRSCKFIARRSHFVCASDDMHIRVYNYNTMEKVKEYEAHADYIRYVEIHPSQPLLLSSSDDMSIKLWNWENNWECTTSYEGHAHYVMMTRFNCKDTNSFASASLDRSIKVWGLGSAQPHYTLEGHERGVNCLDYYPGGDKPYLISGADDKTVKIWDYQTKSCIQTLQGHSNNVCAVLFHPSLPVLVSASEDGTVRIWHATTYRAETTLNYGLERAWSIAAAQNSNSLAIGYDEGTVLIKMGQDSPVSSLDKHMGKLVWANNNDILTASLRGVSADCVDGQRVPLVSKDMGSCEIFPQQIQHNCNGRFLVVCGDGEYIIYTSQALRNKAFGSALDFVWSAIGTGDYAIRESLTLIKIFKNFKEDRTINPNLPAIEKIFGGGCLGVKGADCICFFNWNDGAFLCKIDVSPMHVYWNDTLDLVLMSCEEQMYILSYNPDAIDQSEESDPFELQHEVFEKVSNGQWVGDCFLFSSNTGKLCYVVGGNIMTICHTDNGNLHFIGFLPKEDRAYFIDRSHTVTSYKFLLNVMQYQTAVVRQDFDRANAILVQIPESEHSAIAKFLEMQGYKDVALQVSRDTDHKFDLAIELNQLDIAKQLLEEIPEKDRESSDYATKWKRLGDMALSQGNIELAEKCALEASDLPCLLMIYTSNANAEGLHSLANDALTKNCLNVAFIAFLLLGKVEACLELLVNAKRIPEAAMFARTYLPSQISRVVKLWKQDLSNTSKKAADALADPEQYANLFPDYNIALKVEAMFKQNRNMKIPASEYLSAKDDLDLDLIESFKARLQAGEDMTPPVPADNILGQDDDEDMTPPVPADNILGQDDDDLGLDDDLSEEISAQPALTNMEDDSAIVVDDDDPLEDNIDDDLKDPSLQKSPAPDTSLQDEADDILNDDFNDDDDDW